MEAQKKSRSPPIRFRGKPVTLTQIVSWLFAAPVWLLVFIWVPIVLVFVWMVLQPFRLWKFLRKKVATIGKNFGS